jgi:hypothetical protein
MVQPSKRNTRMTPGGGTKGKKSGPKGGEVIAVRGVYTSNEEGYGEIIFWTAVAIAAAALGYSFLA